SYTITANLLSYNYCIQNLVEGTLTIDPRTLYVSALADNKTYDGTTNATVHISDDRRNGDSLEIGYTSATFNSKDVEFANQVTISGITLSGAKADNYTLASTTVTADAYINTRELQFTFSGQDKDYDGDTIATVQVSDDREGGDIFEVNY